MANAISPRIGSASAPRRRPFRRILLLVQLGVFAHQKDFGVGRRRGEVGERRANPPRRLEPDGRHPARQRASSNASALARAERAAEILRTQSGATESPRGPRRRTRRSGPGSTSTATPAARAAATSALPGSEMPGMPASLVTATKPVRARSRMPAVAPAAFCSR